MRKAVILIAALLTAAILLPHTTHSEEWVIRQFTVENVAPGDALAPHIYVWKDGYVIYNGLQIESDNATISGYMFKYRTSEDTGFYNFLIFNGYGYFKTLYQFGNTRNRIAMAYNNGTTEIGTYPDGGKIYGEFPIEEWYYFTFIYDIVDNYTAVKLGNDTLMEGGFSDNATAITIDSATIYVENYVHSSMIAYVKLVEDNNIASLFDPTFWNGSTYIDLVSGAVGTPYGDVVRVPANETWVWHVTGLYDDGKIHLRFFKNSTEVWVKNKYGELVAHILLESDVEDYAIDVSEDGAPYTVVINMPVPSTSTGGSEDTSPPEYDPNMPPITTYVAIIPNASELFNITNFTGWWVGELGILAYAIPLMIPATIYIKTRSYAITAEALLIVLIGLTLFTGAPVIIKLTVTLLGIVIGALIYKTIIKD